VLRDAVKFEPRYFGDCLRERERDREREIEIEREREREREREIFSDADKPWWDPNFTNLEFLYRPRANR
jgi:hypothetical protein